MALPVIVVKALVIGATDKKARNIFAVIIAAILVPFITITALKNISVNFPQYEITENHKAMIKNVYEYLKEGNL